MKRSRMKLRLLKSRKMDIEAKQSGELHDVIRMPGAARKHYCPEGSTLVVTVGKKEFVLQPKQAYMQDLKKMAKTESKYNIGFVTTQTYNAVEAAKTDRNALWLSEHIEDLIIGSDPEFGLIDDDGLYVYASNRLHNCHTTKFGTDGPCMEIRADPNKNVETHVENIRALIEHGSSIKEVKDLRWWTGATYKGVSQDRRYTIGGHIHIGDPIGFKGISGSTTTRHTIQRRIIRLLDELIGLPLTKIDGPYAGWRRQNTGYGQFGDFRDQQNRLEWRTPSALWLTHPELAAAVMGTTKAVVEECYLVMANHNSDIGWISAGVESASFLKEMKCLGDATVKDKINKSEASALSKTQLTSLLARLKSMSTYKKYKVYIDEFIRVVSMSSPDVKKIKLDGMRDNWLTGKSLVG